MEKNRGGITVFLAVIFMAMLVFTGSLVDLSRIMVAQNKVEGSIGTSARSVLAGYDADLSGEFGLYGLDSKTDMEDEFLHYLNLNLKERHEGISFINYEVQSDSITAEGSLVNKDIIKHQVLEYMKYKAPVSITRNLIEQLKQAKLGQKTEFAGKEKVVREKARNLEEKVKALNRELEAINDVSENLDEGRLAGIKTSLDRVLNVYIPQIEELYASYQSARDETEKFLDQSDPEDNKSNREAGINGDESREFETVLEECRIIKAEAAESKAKVDEVVRRIAPLRKAINDMESQIHKLERSVERLEKQANPPVDTIEKYKDQINELQDEVEEKEQQSSEIIDELQSYMAGKELHEINLYADDETLPEHESADNKAELINRLNAINTAFQQLSVKINKNMLITQEEFSNSVSDGEDYSREMLPSIGFRDESGSDECEEGFSKIHSLMKSLLDTVSGAAVDLRDKLYLTEYIMDKCTFLTSQTQRGHLFPKGEVEYILSGTDIPYAESGSYQAVVIAKVAAEVWFLRFSIDSIDAFAASEIAHPLARLAWALAQGALDASNEMLSMLKGEGVRICPSFKAGPELRYSDHLRLLLLIQNEDETIRKLQQLVQVDLRRLKGADGSDGEAGFRLGSCMTIVKADAEVSINLFFLPILGLDKIGFEQFRDGRYVIKREIVTGY